MKRSEMREQAFLLTFELLFGNENDIDELIELYSENVTPVCDYAKDVFKGVSEKKDSLIDSVDKYSKSWRASRLPKTSLAIMLVAIYEIENVESVPEGVAINEAVELAKKYSSAEDASYINGVLGAYLKGRA